MKYFLGRKLPQFYKGILIKADMGLHDQIAQKVLDSVPSGSSVLDLGAGEGALSARLSDLGYRVTAVDMDANSFKCDSATFSCVNFDSPDEMSKFVSEYESRFDAVLGIEVIEHVQDQWQYIRNLKKMLKPDGFIVITTPNITSWLSRLIFMKSGRFHQFGDSDLDYGHISPISPFELSLILQREGFKDVVIQPAGTLPPFYFSGIRMVFYSLIAFLVRPFQKGLLDGWCVLATARKS